MATRRRGDSDQPPLWWKVLFFLTAFAFVSLIAAFGRVVFLLVTQ